MKLDEFVSTVLTQIVSGIKSAQESSGGAFIVPTGDGGHDYANHPRLSSSARLKSTIVDFDIALTVEYSAKGDGSAGLKVFGYGIDAKGELGMKNINVSRILFAVPVLLPNSLREWHKELGQCSE
ncbi:MAG: hypothetical protein QX198_09875 [Methylococcaceae bacterium]